MPAGQISAAIVQSENGWVELRVCAEMFWSALVRAGGSDGSEISRAYSVLMMKKK